MFLNRSSKEASVLTKSLANLVAISALGASVLWAQAPSASQPSGGEAAPPSDCIPASTDVLAAQYPCIYPDRRVMLRIKAPDAQHVQALIGGGGGQTPTMDMMKQPDGYWTLTTPPIVEGFHYYQFYVDGVEMGDPGSRTFFGEMREISGIEIPSPVPSDSFYQVQDVPHGEVRSVLYFSKVVGNWRRCLVYTPPDYDHQPHARYPVLYLLPGYGEDELGWFNQGRANVILDNLIAQKNAAPMLVVADDQFTALKPGEAPLVFGERRPGPGQRPNFGTYGQTFTEVIFSDLIPFIESSFRALTGRENRAMAGLSMGGMQTFLTTLPHLDQFAYVGGFSPGVPQNTFESAYKDPAAFNSQVKLLWLGTGTVEKAHNPNIFDLHEALNKAGVMNTYFESQGTAHEWLTWRRDLNDFAPRLFRRAGN
ncbi:putative esterase [Candidatus Sulfotelmatomonas gaucii]|uniref:Putative esterase n=1 Tax=Candidatus Sulfuritelmatomonas gaucii TaxID=2043161 RepID=A0A2N9L6G2_9BACT|nr:putative esterase [Candidatus Sulfotelmatomonas gaucii]